MVNRLEEGFRQVVLYLFRFWIGGHTDTRG